MSLGEELAALVAPLIDGFSSPDEADRLLRELGVVTGTAPRPEVPAELVALGASAQATVDALLALDDPQVTAPERILGLVANLAALADAIAELAGLDEQDVTAMPAPFDAPQLWPFLARALPGYLFTRWLREQHRGAFDPLALLGVIALGEAGAPTFDLDRLATVLSDAGPWSDALADLGVLLAPLRRHFDARGVTAASPGWPAGGPDDKAPVESSSRDGGQLDLTVPAAAGRPGLSARIEPADGAAGAGLSVSGEGLDRVADGLDVSGGWVLAATGGPGLGGAVIGSGWAETLAGGTLDEAGVELSGSPPLPWVLLGQTGATRLELGALSVALRGVSLTNAPEVELSFGTSGLRLVIVPGDADSFLAALLGDEISAELALAGRWSPDDGLTIDGAAGLSVYVATTVTIGPLTLTGLTLALTVEDGIVMLLVTSEIGGRIGPVSASVRGMGVRAELLPGDTRGTGVIPLGPVALELGFQPPDGATLAIDLGAAGGGWIDFDLQLGRYSGVIELDLLGVGICAVVIIDTLALGSGEWSLFFALFIDVPAIQLGFGFTLTGLGGLFGFNRTLDTIALESAVRSGSLDTVLFPPDPIGDAPEVIAGLSALFPPSDGRYVFGPVVRIGWGTPTLIEAELGIVLSLPDPFVIAVLGSVTSILPTKDVDLVALHLDVAGVVDAAVGTLSIDASLHDSHVIGFALSGDMAVRAAFLDQPSFLMALGGFHPGFEEPDGFPSLRRLSLGLSAAPVLDISFECYVAITSNSVQFGSQFHLSAEVAGFGIEGGASFDALVEFSPFRLATRLGWYVAVTAVGVDLAGVWLDASVEGPNPWLVVGTARFKALGIEEHVRIDERIGDREPEPALEPEDLLETLVSALGDDGAWAVVAGTSPGVVVIGEPAADELVALPDGRLTVSQRAIPLGLTLDKVGDAPLDDHDTFDVEATGSLTATGTVHDWFAPGYFFELRAGDRLSAPSFERLASGIEFGGGAAVAGTARTGTLDFEEILRDPELGEEGTEPAVVHLGGRQDLLITMAAAGAPKGLVIADDPGQVSLAPSSYAVTDRDTGQVRVRAGTWSAAHQSEAGRRAGTTVVPELGGTTMTDTGIPAAGGAVVPPTFLPWLRSGLAAHLDAPSVDGLATASTAEVAVTVEAVGAGPGGEERQPVPSPTVRLVGPGEVVGLDQRQIVRRDPEPGAADAEPNFFAQVELAAPDLPWRFTPASPGGGLLQPWLALVVVDEAHGATLEAAAGRLPVLHAEDPDGQLPDLAHCWAWAHVHADHDLADGVAAALEEAPEAFRSRLLCPRRLPPGRTWLACVVPTFAAGRQAGLGEPVTATGPAWTTPSAGAVRLPVYHSWRFSTGPRGDFESLVKRLRPRELPGSVGRRDLDVSDPGGGLPAAPGMLLTYEGALVSPAGRPRPWPDSHRDAMKAALRRAVNQGNQSRAPDPPAPERLERPAPKAVASDPVAYDALRDDPIVGPTAYAGPQAGRRTVPLADRPPVWFGELNTEPTNRSVAGLGAGVVRADQEALMAAAWRHAAGIRAVNRTLRRARLAWEVGRKLQPRVTVLDDATLVQLAGPALARLPHPTAGTVRGAVTASDLPSGLVSGAFRRRTRTVRAFTVPGPGGGRRPATAAVTAAALAAPATFAAAWRTQMVIIGTEVDAPLPDLGPLVGTAQLAPAGGRERPEAQARQRGRTGPVIDTGPVEAPGPIEGFPVVDLAARVRSGLDPTATVKAMVDERIVGLPAVRDHDVPTRWRADPDFTTPMSERLIVQSVEYLVPGIGVIPDETLGLLEINQPFVEAFLGGLNSELGREFLWREYPATPGSTWARRFWDRAGVADIEPISDWVASASLGGNPSAEAADASLVLLLKGALPRRYPELRVYAVEADWDDEGKRVEKVDGQVRPPVLAGQLQPDTWFWGFELDRADARGSTDRDQPPGWFFVLEEKPGATRFGLDQPTERTRGQAPGNWSDLRWSHLASDGEDPLPDFADPRGPSWLADGVKRPGNGGKDAWGEDAAAMARITLQRPVRMLVHADSMLPPPRGPQRPDIDIDIDPFDPHDPDLPGPSRPGGDPRRPQPAGSQARGRQRGPRSGRSESGRPGPALNGRDGGPPHAG